MVNKISFLKNIYLTYIYKYILQSHAANITNKNT